MELKDINYFFILHSSSGSCLACMKEDRSVEKLSDMTSDLGLVVDSFKKLYDKIKNENSNFVFSNCYVTALINASNVKNIEIKKEKAFLPRKFIRVTFNNNFSLSTKYTYNKKALLEFYDKLKSQMLESRKQLNDLEM